eukprot:1298895-Pleurochrysis_carterae.AAC.1
MYKIRGSGAKKVCQQSLDCTSIRPYRALGYTRGRARLRLINVVSAFGFLLLKSYAVGVPCGWNVIFMEQRWD